MKFKLAALILNMTICVAIAFAQDRPPRRNDGSHPPPRDGGRPPRLGGPERGAQLYSIEQALSDQAQLHTIAFSGLAFMNGDFSTTTSAWCRTLTN